MILGVPSAPFPTNKVLVESCVDEAFPLNTISEVVADCPADGCVHASYEERPDPVIVIGEEPITVKPVQDAVPAQETVVVATLPRVVFPEAFV